MSVNFRGYLFQDDGDPVSGATVQVLTTDTTSVVGTATTTDSDGEWAFSGVAEGKYDIKITSGTSVRYIRWDDQISLKELDVRNTTGNTTPAATFTNLTNNAANDVAHFRSLRGTGAANDVMYIRYYMDDASSNDEEVARMTVKLNDATAGSGDAEVTWGVLSGNGIVDALTISSSSSAAKSIDFNQDSITFGTGTAATDITLTFDAESADGVITWMEDEDYFQFSDDILMSTTEKIQLRDDAIYIYSSTDGQLDLVADTEIQIAATTIDINGAVALNGAITGATTIDAATDFTVGSTVITDDVITFTPSSSDTVTMTSSTNGAFSLVTVDAAAAAANIQITADGTVDIDSAGVLTLDSGAAINIEPASGSAILLDGTISVDAGVVTGATSITSTAFVGDITGDVTGTADVATVATTVTITDNESTDEDNAIVFTAGGDVDGGNLGLESDGNLIYNPSTGRITATQLAGTVVTATQNSITTMTGLTTTGTIGTGVWQGTAIASSYIAGDAITGAKIADNAIDSEHYTDGSIDNAHIADDAIDSEHYAAGSIDTAHIADDQVTLAKMAGLARGKIIYGDASGDPAALAVGSADYVLTSDGTDVAWAAVSSAAVTAVANGADNRVATFSSSTALNGEANLTFDGTTLTANALVVDDVAIDAKVITMTGSSSDTAVFTAGTNGTLSIVTTDAAAAAANIQITADGTAELAGTTVTLDSAGDIELEATNDINIPSDVGLTFGDDAEKIEGDGTDLTISGNNIKLTATADVVIPADVGITFGSGEKIEGDSTDLTITSGAKINLSATSDIHIPNDVGIIFGGDSEKIEGDGTDLTISANNLTVDAAADITLDAGGADLIFADDGTNLLKITNSSSDVVFQPQVNAKDIKFNQYDGNLLLDINDGGWVGVHNAAAGPGELRIYEDTDLGSHYTGFKAGNATASVSYVLPLADGSADQVLSTNGSGTLAWASAGSGATQVQAYVYAMSVGT